jgi:hypothetical protein
MVALGHAFFGCTFRKAKNEPFDSIEELIVWCYPTHRVINDEAEHVILTREIMAFCHGWMQHRASMRNSD